MWEYYITVSDASTAAAEEAAEIVKRSLPFDFPQGSEALELPTRNSPSFSYVSPASEKVPAEE